MSSPYVYCHGPTQYEGVISGIEVRWQPVGKQRLRDQATILQVPEETIKKMSEHFGFLLAYRLQSSRVVIKTGPHSFTINSKTGERSNDGDHISVEISGGPNGRRKAHIYLEGHGFGDGAYDNISVSAESIMDKKGKSIDSTLSIGNPSLATPQTATSGAEAGGSGYGTAAGNIGSSSSGQGGGYSSWQLAEDGSTRMRFNYSTGEWESQGGISLGVATSGASAWGAGYSTAGGSGQESTSGESEWVWSSEYGRYYSRVTGEWAEPQ